MTLLLINERSGTVLSFGVDHCRALVEEHYVEAPVRIVAGKPAELIAAAKDNAANRDLDTLILIAGDGTAAAIAGILAGTHITFIPLPGGTMNMLSGDLGYSSDLSAAFGDIGAGYRTQIDVGFVNGIPFMNNAVFGVYSRAAESREALREAKGISETLNATASLVAAIINAEPKVYNVDIDGGVEQARTNTLMISNNLYYSSANFRPLRPELSAGKLGVYITKSEDTFDFLSVILEAVTGDLSQSEDMQVESCSRCVVSANRKRFSLTVDGEVMKVASPAEFVIRPGALNVLAVKRD